MSACLLVLGITLRLSLWGRQQLARANLIHGELKVDKGREDNYYSPYDPRVNATMTAAWMHVYIGAHVSGQV